MTETKECPICNGPYDPTHGDMPCDAPADPTSLTAAETIWMYANRIGGFRVGSVVRLISGGPAMTVEKIVGGVRNCIWFSELEVQRSSFPIEALIVVPSTKAPLSIHRWVDTPGHYLRGNPIVRARWRGLDGGIEAETAYGGYTICQWTEPAAERDDEFQALLKILPQPMPEL